MISDLKDLAVILKKKKAGESTTADEIKIEFDFDDPENAPFPPFLSLLCLMPPTSKNLLPKCFHGAYADDSELRDLFPHTIEIDLNGRSLPWEAISLVPFVEPKRMRAFYSEIMEKAATDLSAIDIARNCFHAEI